jgi:hypothetical protein
MKCVLLFESIHQVMRAEKFLKEKGFPINLIPVPRQISSDCGVAIELPWEDKERVQLQLEECRISILGIYSRDRDGGFKKEG